jgi:hypothetical protein
MRELDSDLSGTISVEELLEWWGQKKVNEAIRTEQLVDSHLKSSTPTVGTTATSTTTAVQTEDGLNTPLLSGSESDVENAESHPQEKPATHATEDKKMMSGVANTVGSAAHTSADHIQRLRTWAVGTGPTSIRVLSVLSGLLLCTVSVFVAVIGNIFRAFNLLKIIVDGPMTPMLPSVRSQLKVLSTVVGRGVYQCLIALLALSQGWADFKWNDPLTNVGALLYISCAAVLLVMGVLFMVAGIAAGAKLDKLKTSLQSSAALKEAFDKADIDKSGALDSAELAGLASSLGSDLTPRQLEVAIDLLDGDRDGTVSYEEFSAWWGAQSQTT